jgi:hypothetical protein
LVNITNISNNNSDNNVLLKFYYTKIGSEANPLYYILKAERSKVPFGPKNSLFVEY